MKGLVSKIERFSIHDGTGIRTLVVMKGCPLKCRWCSAPYTQQTATQILHIKSLCTHCGQCITACPEQAVYRLDDGMGIQTDRLICIGCGNCVEICPGQARELSGQYYTPEELFEQIQKDAVFYRRSGGGITVSGGEPTLQSAFLIEFLSLCQSHFIHTAIETTAFAPWEKITPLIRHLDMIFVDLKQMDDKRHIQWTGVSNDRILENIKKISEKIPLVLRIPVIPGFNDSAVNISESAEFAKTLGNQFRGVDLLPYHQLGLHTYEELDREYTLKNMALPTDEHMAYLLNILRSYGIEAKIGG